jgi:hypothetical protein
MQIRNVWTSLESFFSSRKTEDAGHKTYSSRPTSARQGRGKLESVSAEKLKAFFPMKKAVRGLAKLKSTDDYPFIVQACRHLAVFYARVDRLPEAERLLLEAQTIAKQHEIHGQLHQIEDELRRLRGEAHH